MRLLGAEEQQVIYKDIYSKYTGSHFPFQFERAHMKTISGISEAKFLWLALQHLVR
jgi:hypothetical protein